MPEEIVKQHYIALAKLLKLYRTGPLDKNLLKASQHFCKNLYAATKAHPELIFAQPQLYKPQLPFVVNLAFNATVLTCLLAVRNKFDPAVIMQLMCGSLSIYALEQSSLEKHYQTEKGNDNDESLSLKIGQINTEFVELLNTNQQPIWLCSYLLCCKIHLSDYPATSLTKPITALTYLANKLALLCIPNKKSQATSFAQAIKHLSLKCCSKWYGLLMPLLDYPSLSPPGSYIRLQDGSIHIVLSLRNNGLVTKPLPNKQSARVQLDKANIQLTPVDKVIHSFPCQQLNRFARLSDWWGSDLIKWQSSESEHSQISAFGVIMPMQAAPASLLIIQDQLSHIDADIAVIVKAIEKEPTYAQQLQVAASSSNRQKQAVNNIQQSLAMLGFERTNSILLQHSLLSRINQHYFPLQQSLLTFSQLFVFIAAKLAARTKLISPELATTTGYFMVSRLFTLPAIRNLTHWQTSPQPRFKVASLVAVKDSDSLKNGALLLANAWQQNKQILAVLQHYDLVLQKQDRPSSSLHIGYLLGLSLTLAHEYYFSETTPCKETASYCKAGLIELGISQAELTNMMADIVSNTKVYCQLG